MKIAMEQGMEKEKTDIEPGHVLNNGAWMPAIGFGTYKTGDRDSTARAVEDAVKCGYRLIDCAAAYGNEEGVADGIKGCGVGRDELFITSKLWPTELGYDSALRGCEKSLRALGVDKLDLYLVHWPATAKKSGEGWRQLNAETWRAFERMLREGMAGGIGVSNFLEQHLEALLQEAEVWPAVDQLEINPGWQQRGTVDWCFHHGIRPQAWSPLARGRVFGSEVLEEVAAAHGKSVAQVCLRWEIQKGIVPLPKSQNAERMRENLDVFDFDLPEAEMKLIDGLGPFGESGLDPENPSCW